MTAKQVKFLDAVPYILGSQLGLRLGVRVRGLRLGVRGLRVGVRGLRLGVRG